jgi:hypothetical protein
VRPARKGKRCYFDFRAASMFEVTPAPLPHIQWRAAELSSSTDAEDPGCGHGVPVHPVDEATDYRSLGLVEMDDPREPLL